MTFDDFRKAYPKRHRASADPKATSRAAWEKAIKRGADPAHIVSAAEQFADECRDDDKYGTEFVPMSATWLNQSRYEDYEALPEAETLPEIERVSFCLHPTETASFGRIQSAFGLLWSAIKKRAIITQNQGVIQVQTDRLDLDRWRQACYNSGYVLVLDKQATEGVNVTFAPPALAL